MTGFFPSRLRAAFAGGGFVAGVALCWGLLYAPFGHGGDDGGFILALAWRILQGEVPYRDFIYIRPPLSPLLHALPMALLPASIVVIAERVIFYATVGAYSWVAAGLLARRGGIVPQPVLAFAGFVLSILWFPPMPWHTVDGIALSVFGVACLARDEGAVGETWSMALGGLLLFGAAATKQPFALVLPAALIWLVATRGRRQAMTATGGAVVGAGVLLAAALATGIVGAMSAQILGASSPGSLFHSGVVTYARGAVETLGPPLAVWLGSRWIGQLAGLRLPWAAFPWMLVVWMFGACFVGMRIKGNFQPPTINFPAALLVLGAGAAAWAGLRRRDPAAPLTALLLVVAWCASISWGWQTPALFATPILFAVLEAARRHTDAEARRLAWAVVVLGLVLQFAGYQRPYADAPRAELVQSLGDVIPRLSGIRSTAEEQARLAEFLRLHERYGKPSFTVLPGFPLAHFLVDTPPPPGVDWARNAETAGRAAELAQALESAGTRAFVERDRRVCSEGPACSALTAHVVEHWTPVERGRYFDVYVPRGAAARMVTASTTPAAGR